MSLSLKVDGVTTTMVFTKEQVGEMNDKFKKTMQSFPEYVSEPEKYVFPQFGAFGNPASFHNPLVREIRLDVMDHAIQLFRPFAQNSVIRLEQLFDRMCVRKKGIKLAKESWHKDISPAKLDDDLIFGGWINLDSTSQYFSCDLGSHEQVSSKDGFVKLEGGIATEVEVKPGEWICFFQNITHQVIPKVIKKDSFRQFIGFRLTTSATPLYDSHIESQGVPRLPGGMIPSMYEKNNLRFHKQKIEEWSSHFQPQSLTNGLVHQKMQSLADYHLPLYEKYSEKEVAIMMPQNYW